MASIVQNGELIDPFRSFISKSRYARWIEEYGRRETWEETVNRYVDYISLKADLTPDEKAHLRYNVLNHKVVPSMRLVMTAGEAVERSNIAGYNCSFVAVDDPRAFDEALYILMNGTGVGYSVESKHVKKLPKVPAEITPTDDVIVVEDSKEGWAQGLRDLVANLYRGTLPKWDLRQLRPEGARLKTFGGRSSGPAPLNDLFEFTVALFAAARGRKMTTLEAHSLMCKIGSVVVVGGVRRSALISLSSLDDDAIRDAKSGEWWLDNEHFALANNSAVYYEKPTREQFDAEWNALVASGSGERGIFNMAGGRKTSPNRRDVSLIEGTNPCAEILLRNKGFCNLTEVIVYPEDTLDDLKAKVALAAKMGTWQASMTNFPYLREDWRKNAQEEALLGVSMTGTKGHPVLAHVTDEAESWLKELKKVAVLTNRREAKRIGINPAAAVTCNKPSGTVSTLTNSSSGIHSWYDNYFIRRVRISKSDPIAKFMIGAGLTAETDFYNDKSYVFSFPFKAPEGAVTRNDETAIDQLEYWLMMKNAWTEHNPSVTINVKDDEWEAVGNWVFKHFDKITGISFLPYSEHTYQQAPFETIDEETYNDMSKSMPDSIDWSFLSLYELEDTTIGNQTLACTAGVCDVTDLVSNS